MFLVEERANQAVVLCTVYIAQHDGQISELGLCVEPGQEMRSLLVLLSLPAGDVVVGIAWVLVGSVIDECVEAKLEVNLP